MEIREEDFRPSRDMRVGDTSKLGEWWVAWYELASKRLSLFYFRPYIFTSAVDRF